MDFKKNNVSHWHKFCFKEVSGILQVPEYPSGCIIIIQPSEQLAPFLPMGSTVEVQREGGSLWTRGMVTGHGPEGHNRR